MEVIVTMNHVRAGRMCAREARNWARKQGLDWNEFITNGFPESVLTATGDPMAMQIVEIARADPNVRRIGDVE